MNDTLVCMETAHMRWLGLDLTDLKLHCISGPADLTNARICKQKGLGCISLCAPLYGSVQLLRGATWLHSMTTHLCKDCKFNKCHAII